MTITTVKVKCPKCASEDCTSSLANTEVLGITVHAERLLCHSCGYDKRGIEAFGKWQYVEN